MSFCESIRTLDPEKTGIGSFGIRLRNFCGHRRRRMDYCTLLFAVAFAEQPLLNKADEHTLA